jgi:Zn finger protein HypA/HybF involved in hydrogenase expression
MHEASLVRALLGQVIRVAHEHNAPGVRRVVIRVGALGHGHPEHLQWHFTQQVQGTLLEHAMLDIISTEELVDVVLDSVDLDRASPRTDRCNDVD